MDLVIVKLQRPVVQAVATNHMILSIHRHSLLCSTSRSTIRSSMAGAFLRCFLQTTYEKAAKLALGFREIQPLGPGWNGDRIGEGAARLISNVTTQRRTVCMSVASKKSATGAAWMTYYSGYAQFRAHPGHHTTVKHLGFPTTWMDLFISQLAVLAARCRFWISHVYSWALLFNGLSRLGTLHWAPVEAVWTVRAATLVFGLCRGLLLSNSSHEPCFTVLCVLSLWKMSCRCSGVVHCCHRFCYGVPDALFAGSQV